MFIVWSTITLVVITVLTLVYFLRRYMRGETPTPTAAPEPEKRVYGGTCRPGDLCIEGHASAKPEGVQAQERSTYTGRSVTTAGHPFILTEKGAVYIPVQSWWAMNNTYGACVGVASDTIFFLCDHGLYSCHRDSAIRLSDNRVGSSRMQSIHTYRGSAYALADGVLYRLFSATEYKHIYGSVAPSKDIVDMTEQSSVWLVDKVQYINGRDISQSNIRRMTVVGDALYLDLSGTLLGYKKRWQTVGYVVRKGHYCHQVRGRTEVWSMSGSLVREGKGVVGAFIGDGPTLYTIHDASLYRNSQDTGGTSVKLYRGWVNLLPLEDGRCLAIGSGETYLH